MNFKQYFNESVEPSYKDTTFKVVKKRWYSSLDGRVYDEPVKGDDCPLYIIKDSKNCYWEYLQPVPNVSFVQEPMIHKKPQWFWKIRRELVSKGPRNQYLRHSDEGREYNEYLENLEQVVFPKLVDTWKVTSGLTKNAKNAWEDILS